MTGDFFLCSFQLLGAKLQLPAGKIKIIGAVDRYQMQMSMRHLQSDDGQPATIAGECSFNSMRNRFCKYQHLSQIVIRHIEEFIYLYLGDHQHMPFLEGKNIEERIELIILRDLV